MDPEKKSLNFIFPTKYVIPKSLKFSHWPSKKIYSNRKYKLVVKVGVEQIILAYFPAFYIPCDDSFSVHGLKKNYVSKHLSLYISLHQVVESRCHPIQTDEQKFG